MTNIQKLKSIPVGFSILFLFSCAQKHDESSNESVPTTPEASYCSPIAISNPATITGSGTYTPRVVTTSGLVSSTTFYPIRYAEVEIKTISGTLVQCGLTDGSGNFSLQVEKTAADTQLQVNINTRGYSDYVRASILNDITHNVFYSISTNVNLLANATTADAGTINAAYTGEVLSGPFNIFDQILKANEYLRNNTTCTGCTTFTVAPKVSVYWKSGFTPAAYISASYSSSPLSFFDSSASITSTASLFILGGLNGDVNSSDTDHFDNSVIVHEYAHFLESVYGKSDSPGGSHNGNLIVDPRLAWSEAWADFFSAAVLGVTYYRDTIGNDSGTTMTTINLNLETPTTNQDLISTKTSSGEGIFREVSISRTLFDYIDTNSDTVAVSNSAELSQINFAYLWKTFSDNTNGLSNPDFHFRNMGLFNQFLRSNIPSADTTEFDKVLNAEYQRADTYEYAIPATLKSSSCTRTITPTGEFNNPFFDSSDPTSQATLPNMFTSNDFFYYYHPGGNFSMTLSYSQVGASQTDLDLYIYQENYVWRDSRTVVLRADSDLTAENPAYTESVNGNLPAGFYLINVSAFTQKSIGNGAHFDLKVGAQYLCP